MNAKAIVMGNEKVIGKVIEMVTARAKKMTEATKDFVSFRPLRECR